MKACNCLIELDLEEYQQSVPNRQHLCLGGNPAAITKTIRTVFRRHLELPGRRTSGRPVAIIGATHREAVAAAAFFVEQLQGNDSVPGRIRRNVNDLQDEPVQGVFFSQSSDEQQQQGWMFFRAQKWSVIAYRLVVESDSPNNEGSSLAQKQPNEQALRTCLDNLTFRLGASSLSNLDVFVDPRKTTIFASLPGESATLLLQELQTVGTAGEKE